MKNKWTRVVVMIVVGLIAYSVGQNMGGIIGSITIIVGVILLIGGIVEIFKKQKAIPPTSTTNI